MKVTKFMLFLVLCPGFLFAQHKFAYQIYNKDGKLADYAKMLEASADAKLVFFGEYHNNSIAHWLQLQLTKDLYSQKGEKLKLGAEMFESDNQLLINEYLSGLIDEDKFEAEARLWPNYKTDYKPLINFALENKLKFIATNIPRRYASRVHKKGGLDSLALLSAEAKKYIAPLPITFFEDKYMAIFDQQQHVPIDTSKTKTKEHAVAKMGAMKEAGEKPSMRHIAEAQAAKDATMAWFIEKNYEKRDLFLHFNGSMHSNNHEGIINYIKDIKLKHILTITVVSQEDISALTEENVGLADFIICVDINMTTTY